MSTLTAPGSTSVGLTRLGRGAIDTSAELGPLADLLGTWIGKQGWELIAVPTKDQFRLIVRPYIEVLSVEAIGSPVPNRGGGTDADIIITGLMYQTRISDAETHEPLHLENGMWLNLGETQQQPIVRQASIPHGDVFLALGTSQTTAGPPTIPSISGLPDAGPKTPLGYTDAYLVPVNGGFLPAQPNAVLQKAIADLEIVETTTLSVSTAGAGGITNIPFVTKNANATQFTCDYWIERVQPDSGGPPILQLQYSQQTNLEFLPQFGNPGELIMWPHVNINTLHKQ